MQLRCTYCQTMFPISRDEMLAALQHMDQHKQKYYDAHCPKCRRANRVEGKRIELFFPDWKKTIKAMEREAAAVTKAEETPARKVTQVEAKKSTNKQGGKITTAKKPTASAVKPSSTKAKSPAPRKGGVKAYGKIKAK
jgi:hypothetical protein